MFAEQQTQGGGMNHVEAFPSQTNKDLLLYHNNIGNV